MIVISRELLTFLHMLRPLDAIPDLHFISEMLLASEGLMKSCSEVIVSMGILSSHEEKVFSKVSTASSLKETWIVIVPLYIRMT